MVKFTQQTMINARLSRNSSYDGKFYVGVKTMKIYCLPSCRAKLPLIKNIIFFNNREEAIKAGYRGCKICCSSQYPNTSPGWLKKLINYLDNNLNKKFDEKGLERIAGVDITTIRKYFKHNYELSPLAYHRKLRLEYAKQMIEFGLTQTIIYREIGYKSLYGFRKAFDKEYGMKPGEYVHER